MIRRALLLALIVLAIQHTPALMSYARLLAQLPADLRTAEAVGQTRTAAIESAIQSAVNPKYGETMSAFIVSNTHIATLMNFAHRHHVTVYYNDRRWDARNSDDFATLAQILVNQNYLSVNTRYDEGKEPADYRHIDTPEVPIVQIFKACDCYDYQACETDDYQETLARRFIDAIRREAWTGLPGYDDAAWDIPDAPKRRRTA